MIDLEGRIRAIEDRRAMEDCLLAYYAACDSLSDIDGLVDSFTEDARFDLSGLGLPVIHGRGDIRNFFIRVFGDMSHHAHLITNFRLSRQEEHEATGHAYVMGMGRAKTGMDVLVYAYLELGFVRTGAGWKMARFVEGAQMPLPGEVGAIHGQKESV
jgi:hypothetical protein